jgi:hypothetical protein
LWKPTLIPPQALLIDSSFVIGGMPHYAPPLCAHHGWRHFTVRPSRWRSPSASVRSSLRRPSCRLANPRRIRGIKMSVDLNILI